ncbi:MAG: UvrD-helicase domain-containing protein [Myxococcales bacterium]|nr:UvrD-helicase domain-containing protein [Myxococcales bacterium]
MQLNPEQDRAVKHGEGPLMVLAGAGSGKTRVLVQRIAALVGRGVHPSRILAVTFTNKAAGEMKERLGEMLGYHARPMWIGTFHSTCARLLRMFHEEVGLSPDYNIFDDDDQMRLVGALLKERNLKEEATPRSVLSAIGSAKNKGEDPVEYNKLGYLAAVISIIYPMYRGALVREDAVDFNDLLLKVRDLFAHKVVGPQLRQRFEHVLVDEFQDTNPVQYNLVQGFVGDTRNLTVVGDDDQSIYSWRGAEPRNLLDFKRDYPDSEEVKLEQNYRSTKVILAAANGVIINNQDRHRKQLWTDRDGGELVLWEEVRDERAEGDFVACAIEGLVAEEGREWGDMAILYRTHAQSRVLEEMLRSRGIMYKIVGGVSFFQRREVKDIRAYMRLVSNPAADMSFDRIVNVPARGIGKTTVDHVRYYAKSKNISYLEGARDAARGEVPEVKAAARKKLKHFLDIIDGLASVKKAGASVSEFLIQVVERSTYRERLEKEGTTDASDRVNNLAELVSMASDFDDETDGEGTLAEFEERISLASSADSEDGRGSAVTMMTVHAAKGLEYPIVFVVGMEDGLFPSIRENRDTLASEDRKDLEEERRLAYVAFTRAMDRLVLTSARVRRKWADVKITTPSRFLHEIPEDCLAIRTRPDPEPENTTFRRRPARAGKFSGDSYDSTSQYSDVPMNCTAPGRQRKAFGGAGGDEFDQRSEYKEFPTYSVEGEVAYESCDEFNFDQSAEFVEIAAGATVRHKSFGLGRVVTSQGQGKNQKLAIDFSTVGVKTVMARFVDPVF